jgi:capsular exopolysaccharide synthesis family protein
MTSVERDVSLRDYWRVIIAHRWVVVGAVLVAVFAALVMLLSSEPIYEAEAQMLVEPRSGDAVFSQDPTLNVPNLERAIETEIQVLEGQRVRQRVQTDLGLSEPPPEVSGEPVGSTDVVSVRVRSGDPEAAQRLADAYVVAYTATRQEQARGELRRAGDELQVKIDELQAQIGGAPSDQRAALVAQQATFRERLDQLQIEEALTTGGASVVKSAELPENPVEPTPASTVALAAFVGLLVGIGAALLLEYLDDSVKAQEDLESLTDWPVLAVVPVEPPPDNRPIALSEPHEPAVEIYRGLRTNVQFLGLDRLMRIIQVTSSLPGEGKTTTATNLAVVLAQAGSRVALVDGDLRNPRIHEVFNVPPTPGLTEVLLGESADLVINRVDRDLRVITAGTVPPNPSEMMSHPRIGKFIVELSNRYDYVIVDTAPVLPVADALSLSRVVHGVLVVAQANRVSKKDLGETLSRLERVAAPVFGIVLNRAASAGGSSGTYGYGYNYSYRDEPTPAATDAQEPSADRA